ncbi:hypothetical protein M408DRAFT_186115 [Serendipita vermifera MAFF 305830]|uniref:Uncharacterized protein n=1 Tax=Serendipita vermifera MAFF 305830 TaxID=933852 RepID=A0A0C2X3G9_SERVB|nr:hypothetical protein M408DRAFT_186115 [Serendipita vermifera MAFF 305830]
MHMECKTKPSTTMMMIGRRTTRVRFTTLPWILHNRATSSSHLFSFFIFIAESKKIPNKNLTFRPPASLSLLFRSLVSWIHFLLLIIPTLPFGLTLTSHCGINREQTGVPSYHKVPIPPSLLLLPRIRELPCVLL